MYIIFLDFENIDSASEASENRVCITHLVGFSKRYSTTNLAERKLNN